MNRVALITGASAGIGKATADLLHAHGWTVVGASRRGTTGTASTGDAPADATWTPLTMDVDNDASVRTGVDGLLDAHHRIDALVANAGWGLSGPIERTPTDVAKAQFETNFFGAVRVVREALPAMRAQGGGRIVLVSSIGGLIAIPYQGFYSASKFALEGYGEALAYEVGRLGIHVTLVEPGNVRTEFTANRRGVPAPAGADSGAGTDLAPEATAADPYAAAEAKAVGRMERDEANGVAPDAVAAVIERVLDSRRPPRRVSVGKLGERVGIPAKRLLPHRLFEAGARSSLGL